MDIIHLCIHRPVGVSVGVLLVVLFGLLALFSIPVQLTPNVDVTTIKVETRWTGATPQEVEREIVERQEEQLRSVRGLREMRSTSNDNRSEITLEFYGSVDRDTALRDVTDKLRQVSGYPPEVDEPTVAAEDAAADSPIAWLIVRPLEGNATPLPELRDFAEDFIQPYLDRVPGVASTQILGGREREMQVLVDDERLAARGLTLRQVTTALQRQNTTLSAGTLAQGKRDYSIRTIGQFENTDEILDTVIANTLGGPVYIRDVADVRLGFKKQTGFVRSKGEFVLAMPVRREVGANVIAVMQSLREAIDRVNTEVLQGRGMALELEQVYDETVYIDQAIALVRNNIFVGGILAGAVLMLFLRNWRATAVVALSIPISVIGTFLLGASLGRTVNVISLAGMAFAVGMVVDNAIVVLENIFRHYQMGKPALQATYDGASEVWGAVVASTLTTIAVFTPVIFVQEEAGQLFRDISIATVAAVGLSLVVSLTVIPPLAARLLTIGRTRRKAGAAAETSESRGEAIGGFGRNISAFVGRVIAAPGLRGGVIAAILVVAIGAIPFLIPQTTYLPKGNRNLIFGFMITPPGYSVDEFRQMANAVEEMVAPYWSVEPGSPEKAELDRVWLEQRAPQLLARLGAGEGHDGGIEGWLQRRRAEREIRTPPPLIDNFFFVDRGNSCFMGASSRDPLRVSPLANLLSAAGGRVPGVIPIFNQTSIFRISGGNTAEIQVRGDDLDKVTAAAGALFGACQQEFGVFPRATPSNFNLGRPEVQVLPDRERAADLGLSASEVGFIVEAAVEGAYIGDFRFEGGDTIDISLKIKGQDKLPSQAIGDVQVYAPIGAIVPLSSAVELINTSTLETIYRVERQRAVSITITPPETMPLEAVISKVTDDIVPRLRQAGAIDSSILIALTGNANKLVEARNTMVGAWNGFTLRTLLNIIESRFFLSVLIVYLLMAALYESWVYPFVIMFSVPLAVFGGFLGLQLAHWGTLLTVSQPVQQLDVVTFLGFVILVGIVVNNAILLVDQALRNRRIHSMAPFDAIRAAVAARVRPIFLTSLTTIAGQTPLAFFPGAGSELYRGLAAVMLGGLLIATLGTLLLVPCVLAVVFAIEERFARRTTAEAAETAEAAPTA